MTKRLRATLEKERERIREIHLGGEDGCVVSSLLSDAVDHILKEMFYSKREETSGALVALGGYGRGFLNPHSDVDILFLAPEKEEKPSGMLAQLWDLGLKVGHSSRTVKETISVGLSDVIARTSMIECRFLAGDKELYETFQKKYSRNVIRSRPEGYVGQKIEEMKRRRFVNGRYVKLTTPNIKESPGGLRDFHTAIWCVAAKTGAVTLEEMVEKHFMRENDFAPVVKAHCHLLRLRNSIHFSTGRADDVLSHGLQPEIAHMEGYINEESDNEASAELMKGYYESAAVIERFADEMVDFAQRYGRKPWRRRVRVDKDGLISNGSKLHAKDFPPKEYEKEPELVFRIARRISEERLEPAANLFRGLKKLCDTAPDDWFTGPKGGRLLMSILKLTHSATSLSLLHSTGILERLIPAFKPVTGLSQFDMFHRYSVDEHILHTIRKLEVIQDGATVDEKMRHIYNQMEDMEVVKLALLLHDLAKRAVDYHAVTKETHTKPTLERLNLSEHFDDVHFLVENHLLMSDTAQKHNYTESGTLRRFCEKIDGAYNLRRLYLLTYADIAGVGPGIWNGWKNKILRDLFERAERFIIEGDSIYLSKQKQITELTEKISTVDKSQEGERVRAFVENAPSQYLYNADHDQVIADMNLVARLTDEPVAVRYGAGDIKDSGDVTVAAEERLGLFATLAGAFASKNVSVVQAQINTFKDGNVIDTFTVVGPNQSLFSDPVSMRRFEKEIAELVEGKKDLDELVARRKRYIPNGRSQDSVKTKPQVILANHISDESTVIELFATDRIGLLYDITRAISGLGLDIISAKISTEGPRAINVFYVTTEDKCKIMDDEVRRHVASVLANAVADPNEQQMSGLRYGHKQ